MNATREKTRQSTMITSRKIVSNEHLTANGTLFGGYLMCWMDEVAFMCARRFTGQSTCVTAHIDSITFKNPLHLGEHVMLSAKVNRVGRTSMEIEVQIARESHENGELTDTNSAHLTFVCLDSGYRPTEVPRLILETEDDHEKNREAQLRVKVRKKFNQFIERKLKPMDRAFEEIPTGSRNLGGFSRLTT